MNNKSLTILLTLFLSSCSLINSNSESSFSNDGNESVTSESNKDSEKESNSNNESTSEDPCVETNRMQDVPIFHCFNWSMDNIKNNLTNIKNAGFKAIQLSPMQPQKDPYDGNWSSQWWKLYQPFGFSISANYNQNKLGGKNELISLCNKAKTEGIDVIVDIVSNHLAGGNASSFNSSVASFEPEIYNQNLIHNLGRGVNDNDVEALLRGNLGGYPDLKTESSVVQNRVLSLLKEYLDCGVNGFRFDAAKHIETPEDGEYASNYWPTILNGATSYAESKNYDAPYYYGEILNPVGKGRKTTQYTEYMSITDNNHSSQVLSGVVNKSTTSLNPKYYDVREKTVLWAESHDTYSNDSHETTNISVENINKAYVIETSRKGVSTLHLSRPQGNLGSVGREDYKSNIVKAINNFHVKCKKLNEDVTTSDGCFINQRGSDGVTVVNVKNNDNKTVSLSSLKDGTYVNLIDQSEVQVSNHQADISFTDGVSILLNKSFDENNHDETPSIDNVSYQEVYSNSQNITISASNAQKIYYSINNSEFIECQNNTISLGNDIQNGLVSLKIKALNSNGQVVKTYQLIKTDSLVNKSLIVYNVKDDYSYYVWAWKDNGSGKWYEPTYENNIFGIDMNDNNRFIIASFEKGTQLNNVSWDNKIKQTSDISFDSRIYNFLDFQFN